MKLFTEVKPLLVIHNVFAGHFSFGPQEPAMREYLLDIHPQLSLKGTETDEQECLKNQTSVLVE